MFKTYGIVLIGCGHIGEAHIEDIYFRENVKIIGVVDIIEERAKLFARKYHAESWSVHYEDYLDNKRVDIFIIASYSQFHLPTMLDCIGHGKNVLCEKPIAPNFQDGVRFIEAVKASRSKVLIGHILRHNLTYQKVALMIRNGMIGHVKLIRMVQNHHTMDWNRYKELLKSCSPIVDCGVHYFDVMQWFTGAKIIRVGGIKTTIDEDVPAGTYNFGIVNVTLSNGTVGYYEAGWSNTLAAQNTKDFIGDAGRITLTLAGNRLSNREEGDLIEYYNGASREYLTFNVQAKYKNTYEQLCTLIRMIEEGCDGEPSTDEAFSAFKVAIAADCALKSRKILDLDENQLVVRKTAASKCIQMANSLKY